MPGDNLLESPGHLSASLQAGEFNRKLGLSINVPPTETPTLLVRASKERYGLAANLN